MMYYNESVKAQNVDEAFEAWITKLMAGAKDEDSRDGEVVGEVLNAVTVIEDPTRNIMRNKIRKLSMRYCIGEMLWFLSGNNSLSAIQLYSSNWDRMSDDGETVNSNYGYCILKKFGFDQWEYVKDELKRNPNSRRAVLHIKAADNRESKDVNCTVCLQMFIREGKLYMTAYMRSNDLWFGFPYDVFQFTCMQIRMAMELGVGVGSYTHVSASLHLYKRNYEEALKNMEEAQ